MSDRSRTVLLFVICLIPSCSVTCWGTARAGESPRVSWEQVCRVQHGIRWRSPPWSPARCREIAAALNAARDPLLTEAVCINESDLREDVAVFVRPGVYDVGLCGVRCSLHTGSSATSWGSGSRSEVLPADLPSGRCQNGLARGYTLRQLLDVPTNIYLADRILHEQHGGSLRGYNGGTRYASRVGAILSALRGSDVLAKRNFDEGNRRESRLEKLTSQIRESLAGER